MIEVPIIHVAISLAAHVVELATIFTLILIGVCRNDYRR